MKQTPIDKNIVEQVLADNKISDFNNATIRQVVKVANDIEKASGVEFIHMEMGVPGLTPPAVGIAAEKAALDSGAAAIYPAIDGIPELKNEAARFIKAFIDVDVNPQGCVPTTGSMQGSYAAFMLCGQIDPKKDTILFIDPGFSVQKTQLKVMGYRSENFDVYEYRGEKLREKLESYFSTGRISAVIYSNPNNPAWICLTESELQIIGELADKYDVIVLEDLAYLAMDNRRKMNTPFEAPFQPTVAKYCKNWIMMISGSKIFSYAGQRIATVAISDSLYNRRYDALAERYGMGEFGRTFIYMILYTLTSGVTHTAQYALAAMFKAASDGELDFINDTAEYGRRAEKLKKIFQDHGFTITYDKDLDELVSDGFYFTISYPGMTSGELMKELASYGVSAISLTTCGSTQHGLRACTSNIKEHQYAILDERMKIFAENHK
ncbi:MAG: pyridoxal phosphate-dependent aminotransferase [Rikenellaceae bacterium]|nr:pyridoxal phosphate-dependent aminotransferase [Rikenellaceae bacterium]